jgi:hypothetical protein
MRSEESRWQTRDFEQVEEDGDVSGVHEINQEGADNRHDEKGARGRAESLDLK